MPRNPGFRIRTFKNNAGQLAQFGPGYAALGLTSLEAAKWANRGFTPTEAAPWIAAGISPDDASGYADQFLSPADVLK